MKKVFKMKDLDCANCAAKMEANIKNLPEVIDARVNFMMQKLTIESDTADFDALMKEVVKACKKVDSEVEVIL